MRATREGQRVKAKEIKELLELKGWSQAELGRQLGDLDPSTVCCWMSGIRNPSKPAAKIMKAWLEEARKEIQKQPA